MPRSRGKSVYLMILLVMVFVAGVLVATVGRDQNQPSTIQLDWQRCGVIGMACLATTLVWLAITALLRRRRGTRFLPP